MYTDDVEIIAEIQEVVRHEIAHYFGTDEATLGQIEREKFKHKGKGL
jgi:predicted Zn-dependent protease with MMP-like domain